MLSDAESNEPEDVTESKNDALGDVIVESPARSLDCSVPGSAPNAPAPLFIPSKPSTVLLQRALAVSASFFKFNKIFFGYFDPQNILLDNENK